MSTTSIPRHVLSKSTFIRGCQCVKSLWLHKYQSSLRDEMSAAQAGIFSMGTNVGEVARGLFPGGLDASPIDAFHYQQSVADTATYLAQGHTIIYEAAFQSNGVLAAIDILVKQDEKWYAYEVKSSTQVKDTFLQDAALQYHVITSSGILLEDIFLVHINNKYIKQGPLDIEQLFQKVSLKEDVLGLQNFIETKTLELIEIIGLKQMPGIAIGDQCNSPYPCDFTGYCWKDEVEEDSEKEEEIINKKEIRDFLQELQYPLYFMDFETYMLAVPEYDGHWPYRQVPFQFSVHRQDIEGGNVKHDYFLAENDCNPCPQFVERLLACLGTKGSIIVYNKTFENCRLNELKNDYPEYVETITAIQARIIDLMVPFRKKFLYHPAMQGSYSIKKVLPALLPELSYNDLAISDGGDASATFYNLRYEPDVKKVATNRKDLLQYCKLDTWAMVKLVEKMREI